MAFNFTEDPHDLKPFVPQQGRHLRPTALVHDTRLSVAEWAAKASRAELRATANELRFNSNSSGKAPQSARFHSPRPTAAAGAAVRLPALSARASNNSKNEQPQSQPLSEELERRRQRHPRLRWRKFARAKPEVPETVAITGGIIRKQQPASGRPSSEEMESEIDTMLASASPHDEPIIIDQGSLFFTGTRQVIEPPRLAAQHLKASSSRGACAEESPPAAGGGAHQNNNSLEDFVRFELCDLPLPSPRGVLPGASLLPSSRLWKDVPVGVTATLPQEPPEEEVEQSPGRRQSLESLWSDASALGPAAKCLAPFSHVVAKDTAEGRSVRGVPTIAVRAPSREDVFVKFKSWGLDDGYLRCLCSRIPLSTVRGLRLPDNRLTEGSIDCIMDQWSQLEEDRWETLAEVLLPDNRLKEAGGEAVARLINVTQPCLRQLDLSGNALCDRGCEVLCDALMRKCHATLRELALSRNMIGRQDSGGAAVGQLVVAATCLERLLLDFNLLHGVGALAVVQGILDHCESPKAALTCIDLSWNRLGMRCAQLRDFDFESLPPAPEELTLLQTPPAAATSASTPACACSTCTTSAKIAKVCESIVIEGASLQELSLSYNGMRPEETDAISQASIRRLQGAMPTSRRRSSMLIRKTSVFSPSAAQGGGQQQPSPPLKSLCLKGNLLAPRVRTPERATTAGSMKLWEGGCDGSPAI